GSRGPLVVALAALLLWSWPMKAARASEAPGSLITTGQADAATASDPGALVRVTMSSTVGVLLDEVPPSMRRRVEAALLRKPRECWDALARKQVGATVYRLIFRPAFYPRTGRNQLPLPPPETWTIAIERGPKSFSIDGHRLIGVEYTMSSVLVSDRDSPAAAEPLLARSGGKGAGPFVLPVDPELLLQRTGLACLDESELPPNSVDEENALTFYDHTCDVEAPDALLCHLTRPLPQESCVTALRKRVGRVRTSMRFERLPWSSALAAWYRVGAVPTVSAADLAVIPAGLADHRVEYRYIPPGSCALAEGCVGGTGWRRLLKFTASLKNTGGQPLHIGPIDYFITGQNTSNQQHHLFEYSACHNHYHFVHYANFAYGASPGDKRAFCLQTTRRYFNNETTSLVSPYFDCTYQGISPGWGDDYVAGLDCQWIDVTGIDTQAGPVTRTLSFQANPDGFLCEGRPILDSLGAPTYVPTPFTTAAGEPVDRFAC